MTNNGWRQAMACGSHMGWLKKGGRREVPVGGAARTNTVWMTAAQRPQV